MTVVLVLRDDFYPRLAAQAPDVLHALTGGLVNVPATLNPQELRDIVVKPAEAVGLECEDGVPERIVSDMLAANPQSTAEHRAAVTVLPLLELTLHQLWLRRRGNLLTHEAYQRLGGIAGALATWCDTAIDELTGDQQSVAQQILTALVHPADDTHNVPAVRKQVSVAALRELSDPSRSTNGQPPEHIVDEVLAKLHRPPAGDNTHRWLKPIRRHTRHTRGRTRPRRPHPRLGHPTHVGQPGPPLPGLATPRRRTAHPLGSAPRPRRPSTRKRTSRRPGLGSSAAATAPHRRIPGHQPAKPTGRDPPGTTPQPDPRQRSRDRTRHHRAGTRAAASCSHRPARGPLAAACRTVGLPHRLQSRPCLATRRPGIPESVAPPRRPPASTPPPICRFFAA